MAAGAAIVASVATYFLRKKIIATRKENKEPSSTPNRHTTDVFAKAKAISHPGKEQ